MAGGKIFLEPILKNTVGNISGSVDTLVQSMGNVVNTIDPIPTKIDAQINKLSQLSEVIGASAQSLNISDGDDFNTIINNTWGYDDTSSVDIYRRVINLSCHATGECRLYWAGGTIPISMLASSTKSTNIAVSVSINGNSTSLGNITGTPANISSTADVVYNEFESSLISINSGDSVIITLLGAFQGYFGTIPKIDLENPMVLKYKYYDPISQGAFTVL